MRTYSGVVYPAQCDAMGHFNVAHYVAAFDQAMWHAVHLLGYDADWQFSRKEGWADVRHDVTFSKELRTGSLFYVESEVVDIGRTSITTAHHLRSMDHVLRASDQIRSVYFDLDARTALPLPDRIRATALEKIPAK